MEILDVFNNFSMNLKLFQSEMLKKIDTDSLWTSWGSTWRSTQYNLRSNPAPPIDLPSKKTLDLDSLESGSNYPSTEKHGKGYNRDAINKFQTKRNSTEWTTSYLQRNVGGGEKRERDWEWI